jgi:hypothetical protein
MIAILTDADCPEECLAKEVVSETVHIVSLFFLSYNCCLFVDVFCFSFLPFQMNDKSGNPGSTDILRAGSLNESTRALAIRTVCEKSQPTVRITLIR